MLETASRSPKSSYVSAFRAPKGTCPGRAPLPRSKPRLQHLRVLLLGTCTPQTRAHSGGHCGSSRVTPAGPGAGAGRFCAGAFCSRRDCSQVRFPPPPPPGSPPPSTCKRDPGPERQQRQRAQRIPAQPELGRSSSVSVSPTVCGHLRMHIQNVGIVVKWIYDNFS